MSGVPKPFELVTGKDSSIFLLLAQAPFFNFVEWTQERTSKQLKNSSYFNRIYFLGNFSEEQADANGSMLLQKLRILLPFRVHKLLHERHNTRADLYIMKNPGDI